MSHIFSSYSDFSKKFKGISKDKERASSLKRYFERGGVVSVGNKIKNWPKLLYPDALNLKQKIKELNERKAIYDKQYFAWKKKHSAAKNYELTQEVLKFKEPLFWKHTLKYATDKDYKKDVDSIKLPVNLVADKRWQPMIKMFVGDSEYRKNLVETVNYSIVYKNDKKLAKYAGQIKEFRMEVSSKALDKINEKVAVLNQQIKDLEQMSAWANE